MQTPSKYSYEQALKTVEAYENRQRDLRFLESELSKKLQEFNQVKFKVNKKAQEIIFSGLHKETNKLFMGKSVCDKKDKFELVIGKLVAVKSALGESVEEVVKFIEPYWSGGLITGSMTIASTGALTFDGKVVASRINNAASSITTI